LKPDAPLVVTFSNRCFPPKAVFAWQVLKDKGHIALVRNYFAESDGFQKEIEIRRHLQRYTDPLYAVFGKSL
jgi:hypothetical protein